MRNEKTLIDSIPPISYVSVHEVTESHKRECHNNGELDIEGWFSMYNEYKNFAEKHGLPVAEDGTCISPEHYPEEAAFMAGAQWAYKFAVERFKEEQ